MAVEQVAAIDKIAVTNFGSQNVAPAILQLSLALGSGYVLEDVIKF